METGWPGQVVAFLLGLVGNFIASAIYERFKAGQSKRAEELRRAEEEWSERLSSSDTDVRTRAFQDILMRVLRWYLLGNVMFGVSGLGWIADVFRVYALSNVVASLGSLIAVIMFGVALSWLKRYMRYAR